MPVVVSEVSDLAARTLVDREPGRAMPELAADLLAEHADRVLARDGFLLLSVRDFSAPLPQRTREPGEVRCRVSPALDALASAGLLDTSVVLGTGGRRLSHWAWGGTAVLLRQVAASPQRKWSVREWKADAVLSLADKIDHDGVAPPGGRQHLFSLDFMPRNGIGLAPMPCVVGRLQEALDRKLLSDSEWDTFELILAAYINAVRNAFTPGIAATWRR